jgi:hypothetical protein
VVAQRLGTVLCNHVAWLGALSSEMALPLMCVVRACELSGFTHFHGSDNLNLFLNVTGFSSHIIIFVAPFRFSSIVTNRNHF